MAADADIFLEHGRLGRPIALSAGLHVAFAGLLIFSGMLLPRSGGTWGAGGGGDAIGVSLVSTIPLPASQTQTQNVLANESKGLSKSQPQVKENEPDAIPIPDKGTKVKPKPVTSASKGKPQPEPEEETNEVPFGKGGPVSGPYGTFSAGDAKGGISLTANGGDFGTRFGWYVQAVNRKLSENWLRYEVDRSIKSANRVYVVFGINRSGQPRDVHIEQSSGVPSLDLSAVRAVQRIDTFGPLPEDYSGSTVNVEFWFDLSR